MGFFDSFRPRREIDERVRHLTKRKEDCGGHRELSAAEVAPIFLRVAQLLERGFVEIKSGWWVNGANGEPCQVLQFVRNSKAFDYRFLWGVSLPWVPHIQGDGVRWHRTVKSARFDLWDQPYDLFLSPGSTAWQEIDVYFPDRSLGPRCFEADLAKCWQKLDPVIRKWWNDASTPTGVLQRAEEQISRRWEITQHSPDPGLVAAFTLAKLGRADEALGRLEQSPEYTSHSDALRDALASVQGST